MRVLITGVAGSVGRILAVGLNERYELRGFDCADWTHRDDMPMIPETVVGDLADYDTVRRATEGVDAIIHLAAANGGRHPWKPVLSSNLVGAYNLFEAARENGVRRIAYASRAGLLSTYPKNITRTVDMPPKPRNYYSVSKVFGENLGYMYATQHEMQIVCVRIGNFKADRPKPEHPHHLGHRDCINVFERAIIHPDVQFEIVFGVSGSNWPLYDLDHGRKTIGYEPQDYAHVEPEPV